MQGTIDRLKNAVQVAIHVAVPEAQDSKSAIREANVALSVACGVDVFVMLAAIDLDHQAVLHADEIDNVPFAR
jgi:hypothetical protein